VAEVEPGGNPLVGLGWTTPTGGGRWHGRHDGQGEGLGQGSRGQGDRRTEAEGKTDQTKGEAKDAARDVKETAKGVRDSLEGDDTR
jgi:hypothetical protein